MRRQILGIVLAFAGATGCSSTDKPANTKLGLLAPYTGEQGATGVNVERSATMVEDLVAQGGGLPGGSFGIQRRDTANDTPRTLQLTSELLRDPGVWGLIGPFDPGMGAELDTRTEPGAVLLLPGTAVKKLEDASSSRAIWLGPSADEMGCVLAQNAYDAGSRRVAVVYDTYAVSGAMAKEIEATLVRYFSTSKAEVQLISISDGLGSVVASLRAYAPDSIVLSLGTKDAAQVVQDWSVLGMPVNWYLGSGLLTPDLIRNVPPGALEGATAVAAGVPDNANSKSFADAYRARFGDEPFVSAYYYFDASVLGALAIASAQQNIGVGTRADVSQFARDVASAPGVRVTWEQMPAALQMLREGIDIDYQGVTGTLTVTPEGKVIRTNSFDIFRVENGQIRLVFRDACS